MAGRVFMPPRPPHILLLAPGAKVGLTRIWAESVKARQGLLTGWETDTYAPTLQLCDQVTAGGALEEASNVERFHEWCRREKPDLVVPSRHGDLNALASTADALRTHGTAVAVSSAECVALCTDKVAMHDWLCRSGFPAPEQTTVAAHHQSPLQDHFPLIAKDARGSGSGGIRLCRDANDLVSLSADWLLQSIAPGIEFTVNTYVDAQGSCTCTIPHERILVRDGEVVRARTVRNSVVMQLARQISESLPGARGPLNIQIFWDEVTARATVIEINPRFGGGYPLAHRAGGTFVNWLLQEYVDHTTPAQLDDWEENLLMVRYRDAIFHSRAT